MHVCVYACMHECMCVRVCVWCFHWPDMILFQVHEEKYD